MRALVVGSGGRAHSNSSRSRAFSAVEARRTARSLKRLNENDGKLTAATAEEQVADTAEDLASVTVAFENLSYGDKSGTELFEALFRRHPAVMLLVRKSAPEQPHEVQLEAVVSAFLPWSEPVPISRASTQRN